MFALSISIFHKHHFSIPTTFSSISTHLKSSLIALALSASLTSCGGGGGGSGSTAPPPVAATGFTYSNGVSYAGNLGREGIILLDNHFSYSELFSILILAAHFDIVTFPCEEGQITLTLSDQDASESLTVGDVLLAEYNDCSFDNEEFIFGGQHTLTITTASFVSPSLFTFGATFSSTIGLTTIANNTEFTLSGRYQLLFALAGPIYTLQTSTETGDILTLNTNGSAEDLSDITNLNKTTNETTEEYDIGGSFKADNEFYEVSYAASFTENYTGVFESGPSSGTFRLDGPDGAYVQVSSRTNTTAEISADSDGNGNGDLFGSFTWDNFVSGKLFSAPPFKQPSLTSP